MSGKDVLFFGANSALMIYMGTGTIDDIDVDIWNGCIYNKENDLTMNATYYFTCKKNSLRKKIASGEFKIVFCMLKFLAIIELCQLLSPCSN